MITIDHVGFTGTRDGMTDEQTKQLKRVLADLNSGCFHHGDCLGADSEGHDIADALMYDTHVHPPVSGTHRAFRKGSFEEPSLDYLARNKQIVNMTSLLIAAPSGPEELRSGTWSTIRYARKLSRPVVICWPDGTLDLPDDWNEMSTVSMNDLLEGECLKEN